MALQIWYPLLGNLNSLGTNQSITANVQTATAITDEGLYGQSYDISADAGALVLNSAADIQSIIGNAFTMSMWIFPTGTAPSYEHYACFGKGGTAWTDNIISLMWAGGKAGFCVANGSSYKWIGSSTATTRNTWHHCAGVYDNQHIACYLDGVLVAEQDITFAVDKTKIVHTLLGGTHSASTAEQARGYIQDFRFYDHACSAKEIKQQALALSCHYEFSGHNNLINAVPEMWKWSHPSVTVTEEPIDWVHSVWDTNTTSSWNGPCAQTFELIANTVYTISGWAYGHGSRLAIYRYWPAATSPTGQNCNVVAYSSVNNTNTPQFLSFIWTAPYTATYTIYGYTSAKANDVHYKNFKIEEGEHATGFTLRPEYNETNIQYDSSGWQHNGTLLNGPLKYHESSPRYLNAAYFNGSNQAIQFKLLEIAPKGVFTMNFWAKKTELGSKTYQIVIGGTPNFEFDMRKAGENLANWRIAGDGRSTPYTEYSFNEWQMFTWIRKTDTEEVYKNGILISTLPVKSVTNGTWYIGAWHGATSYNYQGYISDFRIYNTALSEADIKELYETSMNIDSNGNISARILTT